VNVDAFGTKLGGLILELICDSEVSESPFPGLGMRLGGRMPLFFMICVVEKQSVSHSALSKLCLHCRSYQPLIWCALLTVLFSSWSMAQKIAILPKNKGDHVLSLRYAIGFVLAIRRRFRWDRWARGVCPGAWCSGVVLVLVGRFG
jgi:hypothetical protein